MMLASHFGDTGVIYNVPTEESIKTFEASAPNDKFALVMPLLLVTKDNLQRLVKTGKVAAVIVKVDGKQPMSFSPDDPCPNCEYSILRDMNPLPQWNPAVSIMAIEMHACMLTIIHMRLGHVALQGAVSIPDLCHYE
ncbi:hypothetical protein SYNPS1DRAFT_31511 [Syncephalis pseudoplumigaleata]|uniref:Nicastrin small lobe domain-containing protein n=1 Tax=Syncephalis pseudoplumigaleata TaxID=1712513 RepID=A0A4P9YV95_9FUNG|nr:hypothetical protein SYNPS1DRAFT_31511 [Syncephalis pseudoplumigaleata]|eukprot:RKP22830.1 hypothetical protein SYNPS1DRAFT_31511 [Syncephalis pseudoplumigaleata]